MKTPYKTMVGCMALCLVILSIAAVTFPTFTVQVNNQGVVAYPIKFWTDVAARDVAFSNAVNAVSLATSGGEVSQAQLSAATNSLWFSSIATFQPAGSYVTSGQLANYITFTTWIQGTNAIVSEITSWSKSAFDPFGAALSDSQAVTNNFLVRLTSGVGTGLTGITSNSISTVNLSQIFPQPSSGTGNGNVVSNTSVTLVTLQLTGTGGTNIFSGTITMPNLPKGNGSFLVGWDGTTSNLCLITNVPSGGFQVTNSGAPVWTFFLTTNFGVITEWFNTNGLH